MSVTELRSTLPNPLTGPVAEPARLGLDALLDDSLRALESLVDWDAAALLEVRGARVGVLRVVPAPARTDAPRECALEALPDCVSALRRGAPLEVERAADDVVDAVLGLPRGRHSLVVPLTGGRGAQGVLLLERGGERRWSTGVVELLDVFGRLLGAALESGADSRRAEARSRLLEERADPVARLEALRSAAMRSVRDLARGLAASRAPLSIVGEPGTGKEVVARAVHAWSGRSAGPFVVFAASAHTEDEQRARLLGDGEEPGCVAAAEGGTLYLDGYERLSAATRAALAEALDADGAARPIAGCEEPLAGRSDPLSAALGAACLRVPPLRERPEDVRPLAEGHLRELALGTGDGPWHLAPRTLAWLERQDWPGNVRELVNVLDRATILSHGAELDLERDPAIGVPVLGRGDDAGICSLREMEKRHIARVLRATGGQIYGPRGAAELLEINPSTLRSRMKKLGLGGARAFRREHVATD